MSGVRAAIERFLLPSSGFCYRCRRPWKSGLVGVAHHATRYSDSEGCFPLCEGCWSELTPKQRLPYYDQLVNAWIADAQGIAEVVEYDRKRDRIRSAVMAGG